MAIDRVLVNSFKARYTVEELREAEREVLEEIVSGVVVTGVTMEGAGGAAVKLDGSPRDVAVVLRTAIEEMEGGEVSARETLGAAVNFSTRRTET